MIVDAAYDLKWKVLEKMCDNTYQFPIKSEDPVVLQHPCIILYLGNLSPYEVYACDDNQFDLKKKDRRKYIDARFNVI